MIDPELIPLVAQRFKALGEPARLTLLAALQQGERSVSELVSMTGRSQPNVSQHLKEMTHARLVEQRREGNRMYYRIADPYVNRICDAVCKSIRASQRAVHPRRATRPTGRTRRPIGLGAAARNAEVNRG
jgi:DNA-binding transcriptional ArsR family regulator